mmetsp:Transcript_47656/g.113442  ORF Transcript_47656/g.113442 Transcript_47656/m.113442 type:complete len:378 (-) Transcript_47656:1159-2292(-)
MGPLRQAPRRAARSPRRDPKLLHREPRQRARDVHQQVQGARAPDAAGQRQERAAPRDRDRQDHGRERAPLRGPGGGDVPPSQGGRRERAQRRRRLHPVYVRGSRPGISLRSRRQENPKEQTRQGDLHAERDGGDDQRGGGGHAPPPPPHREPPDPDALPLGGRAALQRSTRGERRRLPGGRPAGDAGGDAGGGDGARDAQHRQRRRRSLPGQEERGVEVGQGGVPDGRAVPPRAAPQVRRGCGDARAARVDRRPSPDGFVFRKGQSPARGGGHGLGRDPQGPVRRSSRRVRARPGEPAGLGVRGALGRAGPPQHPPHLARRGRPQGQQRVQPGAQADGAQRHGDQACDDRRGPRRPLRHGPGPPPVRGGDAQGGGGE